MVKRSPARPVRVMIVDDHPAIREGLAARVRAQPDMVVCGEAADVRGALRLAASARPDVMIVDLVLKDGSGLDLIKELAARHSRVKSLAHSMYDESAYAVRCLQAGARGYITKASEADDFIGAIRTVLAGDIYVSEAMQEQLISRSLGRAAAGSSDPVESLTARELEIFRMTGEGLTAAQIASRLCRSIHTIETHRENVKRKLGVANLAELTRRAVEWVLHTS